MILYTFIHRFTPEEKAKTSSLCLFALWPWAKKLHWNEICPVAGKDDIDCHLAEVQDCTHARD